MTTKTLVIAVVGVGCTVAAGTGAFLAQRMNITDAAQASQLEMPAPVNPPATATMSEVVVQPEVLAPAPVAAPVRPAEPRPAPAVRRAPEVSRPARPQPRATPAPEREAPVADSPVLREPANVPVRPEPASAAETPAVAVSERRAAERVELVVREDSVIGIRMESSLSSETAQVEDRVTAVVTRDVVVDGRTAIPAGSRLSGVVVAADRGGRFRERARLGVQFNSLRLPDSTTLSIRTEPVYRDGESPSREAATKIGIGAAAGAVIGGIVGGKKGAVIGGATGAGAGTAVVTTGARNAAILESGASLTVRLMDPVSVTVDRNER
jgi:type IV secretory pathway VirB10-like protein